MLRDALFPIDVHKLGSKLPVDHGSVADDNNGVDIRMIDHPFGQPGDGFGLAAAGTVPDQIPAADTVFLHIPLAFQNCPQLMIARENHCPLIVDEHEFPDFAK